MASFASAQDFFVSNDQSPEPFVSRAKALPAKRSEKGYGDENAARHCLIVNYDVILILRKPS